MFPQIQVTWWTSSLLEVCDPVKLNPILEMRRIRDVSAVRHSDSSDMRIYTGFY